MTSSAANTTKEELEDAAHIKGDAAAILSKHQLKHQPETPSTLTTPKHLDVKMSAPEPPDQVGLAIQKLQNDHESGARQLATKALQLLAEIDPHPPTGLSFWFGARKCGYRFATSRPSMSSGILSVVARAMAKIKEAWIAKMEVGWEELQFETFEEEGLKKMIRIAREVLWDEIAARKGILEELGMAFGDYLNGYADFRGEKPLRILTLSSSSSLKGTLGHVLDAFPGKKIDLRVLESRPKFEGASFATSVLFKDENGTKTKRENVSITVAPDSHVASLAKDIDILLLGADRISSSGDVSNKMGSLAAALCTKALNPCAKVIVISETDKIATAGEMEDLDEERNDAAEVTDAWDMQTRHVLPRAVKSGLVVENVYFEWVPAKHVDVYVTEQEILDTTKIEELSREMETLQSKIFDEAIIASAAKA